MHPDVVVLTRLIPDAHGTSCNERLEPISGCQHARILRVPFRDREGCAGLQAGAGCAALRCARLPQRPATQQEAGAALASAPSWAGL